MITKYPKVTVEQMLKAYNTILTKMAKDTCLIASEYDIGYVMPIGCKKGLQFFLKATRVNKTA